MMRQSPATTRRRPSPGRLAIDVLHRSGALRGVHALWRDRLTVLAYHRIERVYAPGFDTFMPNVSATPEAFAEQMDFMKRRFNVISIAQLRAWLRGEGALPPYAALITFDDGYRDNYLNAAPILQARGIPAVIFCATGCIGSDQPFYWDRVAYCFHHSPRREAELPLLGRCAWQDAASAARLANQWIMALKPLPESEKRATVAALPALLDVPADRDDQAFGSLHMDWAQLRSLSDAGIEIGAHTVSHPILSRVDDEQARAEILASKEQIERAVGRPVHSFAYPNGMPGDFSDSHRRVLREAGIDVAFSLIAGPTSRAAVRADPLAIRRIFIGHRDTLPVFAAKVTGLSRLRR